MWSCGCITWTWITLPERQTEADWSGAGCASLAVPGLWEWSLRKRWISGLSRILDHSFSFHFFFFNLIYSSLTLCRLMWLELYLELLCNFTFKHYTYPWNHLEISHTKIFYISYRPVQLAFLRYLEYFKMRFGIRLCFGSLNLTHRSPTGCNQFNFTNTALITLAAITHCKLPAGISHILFYT